MTDFNDSELLGLRDLAAIAEDCRTMFIGGTHMALAATDWRTPDGDMTYAPLIAALGKAYIEECMLAHPAGSAL